MSSNGWIILAVANLPTYFLLGWVVFREWDEFLECLRFWVTPDIISMFQGEYWDDRWAEMKLFFWAALCALSVYLEYTLVIKKFIHP